MTQKIEISSKTIVFTVFFLIFLKILWQIRDLIFAIFIAFILMSALKPPVRFLERIKIPRALAVLIVFLVSVFLFSFVSFFIFPPLIKESVLFFKNLPSLLNNLLPNFSSYLNTEVFTQFLPNLTENFVKIIASIFSNFVFSISIFVFTFYFLIEEKILEKFLKTFLEKKQAEEVVAIFEKVEQRMGSWLWGEIILMVVIGLMSYLGLTLLGIKYAFPLSVIAGLLEVIPIIGPTISTIPAFFVAASSSWFLGLSVIALYFLIQQLENNMIVPLVMRKTTGLNPIVTLMALTIGGKLGGFLGILLSVPMALFLETVLIELVKIKKR